jgi:hypothetical protein
MNSEPVRERPGLAYAIAILGSFLIVTALVWAMHRYTQPAPLGADRAQVRARALAELRAYEKEALENVAWIDQAKGLVRLRIEDAMRLVERAWQDPASARSNLITRVEKANELPPKAPEKPSPFE